MSRSRADAQLRRSLVALVATTLTLGVVGAIAVPAVSRLAGASVNYQLPDPSLRQLFERSVVYDVNGRPMTDLFANEDRSYASLAEIPLVLRHAVLAAEDRNFYEHGAVDVRGLARAVTKNIGAGGVTQGGSTITQQLVKNTMFQTPKRDLSRKVHEAVLAVALEQKYSKNQIFEQYLNTIYFGHGAYGVRAAAERYFGHPLARLDPAQAALLAALIANPSGRDPLSQRAAAATWRAHVLDEMTRAGWISVVQARRGRSEPLPRRIASSRPDQVADPFVEEVKRELLADPRVGATTAARQQELFEGGLKIYTTFDPQLQVDASFATGTGVPPSRYTAAMVVVDNSTGGVRALVPGAAYVHGGLDLATQGARPTGSAFKAITLAAALEAGYSPDDVVDASSHCSFAVDPHAPPWNLHNFEGESLGNITLTKALAESSNCAFARVALGIGPQHIVEMAHRLGIDRPLQAVPSITLGTEDVTPLEMASAFSVFAADGVARHPHFVDHVVAADGGTVLSNGDAGRRVLAPNIARTETAMLTHVISEGTAHGSLGNFGRAAAGKTGTTDGSSDAWFVGYTPQLTAAVWLGNPHALDPIVIDGAQVVGGSYPARIWGAFMSAALAATPATAFAAPDQSLWPPPGRITEFGRNAHAGRAAGTSGAPLSPVPPTTVAPTEPSAGPVPVRPVGHQGKRRRSTAPAPAPPPAPPPPVTTAPPTTSPPDPTTTVAPASS